MAGLCLADALVFPAKFAIAHSDLIAEDNFLDETIHGQTLTDWSVFCARRCGSAADAVMRTGALSAVAEFLV